MNPIKGIKNYLSSRIIALIFAITRLMPKSAVSWANARQGASQGISGATELLLLSVGGIFVVVGITIVQPALNNLTTGVSPVISPTSTTGTLIPYVSLFLILAYLGLIIAVLIKAFR